MLDDTPDELVFDLIGETVVPRPGAGPADHRQRRRDRAAGAARTSAGTTPAYYEPGNIVVAAAGAIDHERFVELVARVADAASRRRAAARARAAGGGRARLPGARHRAVPRVPGGAGHHAPRRAAVRAGAARPDARQRRLVAPVPGDPRAPRHGLRRLLLHLALRRLRHGRHLPRHARGERRGVPRGRGPRDRRAGGGALRRGRAGARQGQHEGPARAGHGVHGRAHEPPRQGPRHERRAARRDGGRPPRRARDGRRHRRPGGRRCTTRRTSAPRASGPTEKVFDGAVDALAGAGLTP